MDNQQLTPADLLLQTQPRCRQCLSSRDSQLTLAGHCVEMETESWLNNAEYGHIPKDYYEHAQRALSTIMVAGTFMAGVEAQLLSLVFSADDTTSRSISICFGMTALLATSFVALYAAVTYIWLKNHWRHGPKRFEEWVAGSHRMMLLWCAIFLVVGVYAGFFGLIFFIFAAAPGPVAIFCAIALMLCGVGPMTWGFYYWLGLYQGWLQWMPGPEGGVTPKLKEEGESLGAIGHV